NASRRDTKARLKSVMDRLFGSNNNLVQHSRSTKKTTARKRTKRSVVTRTKTNTVCRTDMPTQNDLNNSSTTATIQEEEEEEEAEDNDAEEEYEVEMLESPAAQDFVVFAYRAQMSDELDLEVGDYVEIFERLRLSGLTTVTTTLTTLAGLAAGSRSALDTLALTANLYPECVAVSAAKTCAPWTAGLFINATAVAAAHHLAAPATAASWDTALQTNVSSAADSLNCNAADPPPVQFWTTYVCLRDLFVLSADCNDFLNAEVPSTPLCADTCDAFNSSISNLLESCPDAPPQLAALAGAAGSNCKNLVSTWASYTNGSACIESVTVDQLSCGFGGDSSAAEAYCSSSAINFSADCCSLFKSAATSSATKVWNKNIANLAAFTTATAATATTNGVGGLSAIAIVGIVIGSVLFVALGSIAWILYSNRTKVFKKGYTVTSPKRSEFSQLRSLDRFNSSNNNTLSSFSSIPPASPPTKDYFASAPEAVSLAVTKSLKVGLLGTGEHKIVEAYTAQLPDELSLKVGGVVEILESHDDGWARGKIKSAAGGHLEGMFPLACVGQQFP
ncbi:hypothetical protein HK100_002634, partial [Physocladia obscura]